MNFFSTLLVVSMVDCSEFHERLRSVKNCMVNCGEILQHILSNFNRESQGISTTSKKFRR